MTTKDFKAFSKVSTNYSVGYKDGYEKAKEEQIIFLNKVKERLKGYACGYHKELDKMLDNEIKRLKK